MSKRITKAMAESAAKELTKAAFNKRVEKAEADLTALVDHLVSKYIPEPVRQCGVEYLNAYNHDRRQEFCTEGYGGYYYKYLYLSYSHPLYKCIALNANDWNSLEKADKLVSDLKDRMTKYKNEVVTALVTLRTEQNVQEKFPEALPFLNFTKCTALVPDFSHLRVILNNQNL